MRGEEGQRGAVRLGPLRFHTRHATRPLQRRDSTWPLVLLLLSLTRLSLRSSSRRRFFEWLETPGETRRLCTRRRGENDRLRLAHSWKRLPKRISKRRVLNHEGRRKRMTLDDDSVFFRSFVLLSSPFSFENGGGKRW